MQVSGPNIIQQSATIASGGSLSSAIDIGNAKLVGIQMPSSWTAASLTFQASYDGLTYADLYDNGTERAYTVSSSRFLALNVADWLGVRWLKIRSGTSAAPTNQGADRSIKLVLQP